MPDEVIIIMNKQPAKSASQRVDASALELTISYNLLHRRKGEVTETCITGFHGELMKKRY